MSGLAISQATTARIHRDRRASTFLAVIWLHEAEASGQPLRLDETEYQGGGTLNKRQPMERG